MARHRLVLALLLLVAAVVFLLGINWGLPSRAIDPFLFGDQQPWTGERIVQLAPQEDESRGADVDANPLGNRSASVWLNQTDAQRAEIVRRYRLFSYQPDEMITFKSLSKIAKYRGDPRLYQYGGLWIYPVGALLKVGSMLQLVDLRADQTYYLDHTEAFGRFYVVARLYSAAWGGVGAWAVFWIARRFSGDVLTASFATLCYTFMPVVVNMAHEAKPHLPAAVLILLATIAAANYVDTGKKRWWTLAAALCGAAMGMVLSAVVALVIPVVMVVCRRGEKVGQRITVLVGSALIAADVYFLTNPYVLVHLLRDRTVLISNLQNSQAMYREPASVQGLVNAVKLIGVGTAPTVGVAGALSVLGFALSLSRKRRMGEPLGWILVAVGALVFVQFAMLATGKPAEYARFALVPDIAIAIVGVVGASMICRSIGPRVTLLTMIFLGTAAYGASYVWHFLRDSVPRTTRIIAAERLRALEQQGAATLALAAEPAPYSMPPVDLFKWKLVLVPDGSPSPADVQLSIRTVDWIDRTQPGEFWTRPRLAPTPISWAAKPFLVTAPPARPAPNVRHERQP